MTLLTTQIMKLEEKLGILPMHRYTKKELDFTGDVRLQQIYSALEGYRYNPPEKNRKACDFKTNTN